MLLDVKKANFPTPLVICLLIFSGVLVSKLHRSAPAASMLERTETSPLHSVLDHERRAPKEPKGLIEGTQFNGTGSRGDSANPGAIIDQLLLPLSDEEYARQATNAWIYPSVTFENSGYTTWSQLEAEYQTIMRAEEFLPCRRMFNGLCRFGMEKREAMLQARYLYGDAGNVTQFLRSIEKDRLRVQDRLLKNADMEIKTGFRDLDEERSYLQGHEDIVKDYMLKARGIVESTRRRLKDQFGIQDERFLEEVFTERPENMLPSSRH